MHPSTEQERARIESRISRYLIDVSGVPSENINLSIPFEQYGLTSLQFIGLLRYLEAEIGRKLPPTLVWNYPSGTLLATYLATQQPTSREKELATDSRQLPDPIAIVGMACRFPGADSLEAFWRVCWDGVDTITEVPSERWDVDAIYDPTSSTPGKTYCRWGGFLSGLDQFDAEFFGISPREAKHLDPRQRLILELAWEAFEDAGIPPLSLAGSRTGVIIATLTDDYGRLVFADPMAVEANSGSGTAHSVVSNRLSYFLDLRGPSVAIDTACSGSLVAIHLGCQALRDREAALMVVGGVNVILCPDSTLFFSRADVLSHDGRCKTFDASADGFVRSEGAGVIVLKPLSRAIHDRDRIYAVIRGSAINQDGRTSGIMAPNGIAQVDLLREAYRCANVSPKDIQYIEAHGTGTQLGDPIEVDAIAKVLAEGRGQGSYCAVGSVKTNIGHTESAAGVAGIIKTALAIHRRALPASIHYRNPNPLIGFDELPLRVQATSGSWPDDKRRLLAGVSGFGFGGTNAHVVLEEPPTAPGKSSSSDGRHASVMVPVSAHSKTALRQLAGDLAKTLSCPATRLEDVAYTAGVRRSHLRYRLAIPATTPEEAAKALEAFARNEQPIGSAEGVRPPQPGKLALVFSGHGSHWVGMGLGLWKEHAFRESLQACDSLTRDLAGISISEEVGRSAGQSRLDDPNFTSLAIFAMQVALANLWRALGVIPDLVIGQSVGEVAAAYIADALELEDAIRVVVHRGRLMKRAQGQGRTAQIHLGVADVADLIARDGDGRVFISGTSSPKCTVVAGEPKAIFDLVGMLRKRGILATELPGVEIAFHSPQMDPLANDLVSSLHSVEPHEASIPFVSSTEGSVVSGMALDAKYWGGNLRRPFLLSRAVEAAVNLGATYFLEVSPHTMLSYVLTENLTAMKSGGLVLGSMRRDGDARRDIIDTLARLYAGGYDIALEPLLHNPQFVSLPSYPWQREKFWIDTPRVTKARAAQNESRHHPLMQGPIVLSAPPHMKVWELACSALLPRYLTEHRVFEEVVFPGAGYVEMALAAAREEFGPAHNVVVEGIMFRKRLALREGGDNIQLVLTPDAEGGRTFQVWSTGKTAKSDHLASVLHAEGRIAKEEDSGCDWLDFAGICNRCSEVVDVSEHYLAMQRHGLQYGERFRAIRSVRRRDGEAIAEIALPESLHAEAAVHQLHTVLLDAAFQVVAAAIPGEDHDSATFLPISIDRVLLRHPNLAAAHCHVTVRRRESADLVADIVLVDSNFLSAVELTGVVFHRLGNRSAVYDPTQWTYTLSWEACEGVQANELDGVWIVIDCGGKMGGTICERLERDGIKCVLVESGLVHRVVEPGVRYEVAFCRDGANWILDELQSIGVVEPRGAIFLSALASTEKGCIERAEELVVIAAALVSALIARDIQTPVWFVTRGAQPVNGDNVSPNDLPQAALWGFGRTLLHKEHTSMRGALIDLDPAASSSHVAEWLRIEISQPDLEDQIAYRNGIRYRLRLRAAVPTSNYPVLLNTDAAYIVTGALGSLGLHVARWLAQRGARRIIAMARTPLPPRTEWRTLQPDNPAASIVNTIIEIEGLGATVESVKMDVGNELQLAAYLDAYEAENRPPIRGVMHVAGVLHDELLGAITRTGIEKVLLPKIRGAWNLHRALANAPLDFFVMFSSLASVLPNAGQASYAAANAFLDALASTRLANGQPAVSIGWGPWEAGMMADPGLEQHHSQRGMHSMTPAKCTDLLTFLARSREPHWIVAAAEWDLVCRTRSYVPPIVAHLGSYPAGPAHATACESMAFANELRALAEPERERFAELAVREIVARVLRIGAERIDPVQSLHSLGLDSLMATELRNFIDLSFGVHLKTVQLLSGPSTRELGHMVLNQLLTPIGDQELAALASSVDRSELERMLDSIEGMKESQSNRVIPEDRMG